MVWNELVYGVVKIGVRFLIWCSEGVFIVCCDISKQDVWIVVRLGLDCCS